MDAQDMRRAVGVPEKYIKHMPAWYSMPSHFVEGVRVTVMGSQQAKNFWNKPNTNTPMRVIAECPHCGRIVAASRINQHAKVHDDAR